MQSSSQKANSAVSYREALDVMEEQLSLPELSEHLAQGLLFQLLEILKLFVFSKLKPGEDGGSVVKVCREADAERALENVRRVLERNSVYMRPLFWMVFQNLLNLTCLSRKQASNEVRSRSLRCMELLLRNSTASSEAFCQEALNQTEMNNCIAFAAYKCFERIHEEHPRGDQEIARVSLSVLSGLLNVFCSPSLWFGILPSAASELSAYLAQTGRMVDNQDAVFPWSKVTADAIDVFCSLILRVFDDEHVRGIMPSTEPTPLLHPLHTAMQKLRLPSSHDDVDLQRSDSESEPPAVQGSWEWYQFSSSKTEALLKKSLPQLTRHPNPTVRRTLAQCAARILEKCAICLKPSAEDLIRILMTLSTDLYPNVSDISKATVDRLKKRSNEIEPLASENPWIEALEHLIKDELATFAQSLRASEHQGRDAIRMLTAAVHASGGEHFIRWVIEDLFLLRVLLRGLSIGFTIDEKLVAALYQTSVIPCMPALDTPPLQTGTFLNKPMVLLYVTEEETYESLQQLIRSISAELPFSGFKQLLDSCLDGLRSACDARTHMWRLKAASHIYVLSEIVYSVRERTPTPSQQVECSTVNSMEEIDRLGIWETVKDPDASLQTLGEDAVLVGALLRWVFVCAHVLRKRLSGSSCHVMQFVLMPVLEKCADPCSFVQSAAETTLRTLCACLELDKVSDLVKQFADYVIEGVCGQLRNCGAHPRAPFVLASLLKQTTGQSAELLQLLAEPVSHALKGLAIQRRVRMGVYSVPFLEALVEVAVVTKEASASILVQLSGYESLLRRFSDSVTSEILDHMKGVQSAAALGDSIVQLCTPLLLDPRRQVALLACRACSRALRSLLIATKCCDLYDDYATDAFPRDRPEASMAAVDIPRLNQVIGPVWKNLIVALKQRHVAIVEGVLEFFWEAATVFDGRTLSRRFADEAWPVFKRILREGHAQPPSLKIVPHKGSFIALKEAEAETATASKIRSHIAVLSCLGRIGHLPTARPCLKNMLVDIAETVLPFLGAAHCSEVQDAAADALKSVALVDGDLLWSILTETTANDSDRIADARLENLMSFIEKADVPWHVRIRQTYLES